VGLVGIVGFVTTRRPIAAFGRFTALAFALARGWAAARGLAVGRAFAAARRLAPRTVALARDLARPVDALLPLRERTRTRGLALARVFARLFRLDFVFPAARATRFPVRSVGPGPAFVGCPSAAASRLTAPQG